MKRIVSVLALLGAFAIGSAYAQLAISGNLGFNYQSPAEKTSVVSFSLLPDVNYGINNMLAVGGKLGFNYNVKSNEVSETTTSTSDFIFTLAPYVRFFALGNDRVSLFFDGQIPLSFGTLGKGKVTTKGKTVESDGNGYFGFGLWAVPGIKVNLSQNFALLATANVARLGYQYTSTSTKSKDAEGKDVTTTVSQSAFAFGVNNYQQDAPIMIGIQMEF